MLLILMRNIFLYCGIYTTIATTWRLYEITKYGVETPSVKDTKIALFLAFLILLIFI